MAKEMLGFKGLEHLLTSETTLKDCYKLCAKFSSAQDPIYIYTSTVLHIKFGVPLSDLEVCPISPISRAAAHTLSALQTYVVYCYPTTIRSPD